MATSVLFSNSPPSSASHQRWTTALVETSHGESSSTSIANKRVRKKSSVMRPTSPFEMTSPENSVGDRNERRAIAFDKQELVDNGTEIQKSLSLLDNKIGRLETMILNLMEKFPLPPATTTSDVSQNINV